MYISNTPYHIVPVLSDTVISPDSSKVFLRLLKDKLDFRSSPRNFIVNDEEVLGYVIYTNIVKTAKLKLVDSCFISCLWFGIIIK